jgi:hypothetical protein
MDRFRSDQMPAAGLKSLAHAILGPTESGTAVAVTFHGGGLMCVPRWSAGRLTLIDSRVGDCVSKGTYCPRGA